MPPELDAEAAIDLILRVIEDWNTPAPSSSSSSSSPAPAPGRMIVRLILTVDRAKHTADQASEIVDLAIRNRAAGRPVVGVDLAGDPSPALRSDLTRFRPAFARAKASGLGLTVHFAELPSSTLREEMEEMLSWNPDRLGHAIHVPLDIRRRIVERGLAVELCLTCNVLAGMLPETNSTASTGHATDPETRCKAGYTDHHFGWWWRTSPTQTYISLGTDDVGVFLSTLSDEHLLAARHFGLSREDLIALSGRAARGAFDPEAAIAATRVNVGLSQPPA